MQLGDRYLVVQRAQMGTGFGGERMDGPYPAGIVKTTPALLAAVASTDNVQTSRVIQMLNMVVPEDLLDDAEYAEILEDTKEECGNFGTVEEVKIPRPIK